MENKAIKNDISQDWVFGSMDNFVEKGIISLGRGDVISKNDIKKHPGNFPIYSSSVKNNGLCGKYGKYMFDEELITWSVDGGGDFFYRPKHKFSVTNVSGYMKVNIEKFDYKFLAYYLQNEHTKKHFDYQHKAHPSVIRKSYYIVMPSISEQQKIAEIFSTVDEEIGKTQDVIKKTEKLKKGLMQELFSHGIGHIKFKETKIGEIPEKWKVVLLDSVAKRGSGHTPNKKNSDYYNGDIKWISLADTKALNNGFIKETKIKVSHKGIKNSSAVVHKKGSIVLSRDASVGRVAVMGENMAVSQHFMVWTCGDILDKWYLYYHLQSRKNEFERVAIGTTIKTI